jgi:aminoglycoside phosphotransferase (APT) family kinase protein
MLADLASTLSYWHDPGDRGRGRIPVSEGLTDKEGLPTADWLAQRYAARTGRDLGNLSFYMGLALMKLAVITEGVHPRYLGGQTVGEGYDRVGARGPAPGVPGAGGAERLTAGGRWQWLTNSRLSIST